MLQNQSVRREKKSRSVTKPRKHKTAFGYILQLIENKCRSKWKF